MGLEVLVDEEDVHHQVPEHDGPILAIIATESRSHTTGRAGRGPRVPDHLIVPIAVITRPVPQRRLMLRPHAYSETCSRARSWTSLPFGLIGSATSESAAGSLPLVSTVPI